MSYVEIEVKAKTVDLAVEAAMQELGVDDREQLSVTVVQEPEKGFLGMGGTDAIVQVKQRKPRKSRRDRGNKGRDKSRGNDNKANDNGNRRKGNSNKGQQSQRGSQKKRGRDMSRQGKPDKKEDDRDVLSVEKQTEIAKDFLSGLVDAYGLEGEVVAVIDDEVIVADIKGEQTEALIGVRGSVRSAIHELTRTVLQRYAQDTARLRLDIAGYAERRREALTIYAKQLIEQLENEGGELMLEPMSSADRKVIHDAAGESEKVESYSEGDPPRRYVVLAATKSGSTEEE